MFSGSSNMWLGEAEVQERMADIVLWVEQSVAGVRSSARASLVQKEWTPDFFFPSQGESSTRATPGTYPARTEEDDFVFSPSTSGNQRKPKNKSNKFRRSNKKDERSKPNTSSRDGLQVTFGIAGEPSRLERCESANGTSTEDETDNSYSRTLPLFRRLDLDGDFNYMAAQHDEYPMAIWDLQPLCVLKEILTDSEFKAIQKIHQGTVIEPSVTAPCQQSTHAHRWPHTKECVKKCYWCDLFYLKCTKPWCKNSDGGNHDENGDEDGDAQCPVCGWRNRCNERDDICRITGEILRPSQE